MARMFERRTPGKFDLRPQYWDPEKEEREERERRVKAQMEKKSMDEGEKSASYGESIRGAFTGKWAERRMQRRASGGRRIIRLFFVLIIVFLIVMYVMAKNADKLVQWIGE